MEATSPLVTPISPIGSLALRWYCPVTGTRPAAVLSGRGVTR